QRPASPHPNLRHIAKKGMCRTTALLATARIRRCHGFVSLRLARDDIHTPSFSLALSAASMALRSVDGPVDGGLVGPLGRGLGSAAGPAAGLKLDRSHKGPRHNRAA